MTPQLPAEPGTPEPGRTCAWCSGPIPATRRPIAEYCSARCIRASHLAAAAERARQARASMQLECANPACARTFTPGPTGRMPKYCSTACRHTAANRNRPVSPETARKAAINRNLTVITDNWPQLRNAVASITSLAAAVQAAVAHLPASVDATRSAQFQTALTSFRDTADQITSLATACHDAGAEFASMSRLPKAASSSTRNSGAVAPPQRSSAGSERN